MEEITMIFTGEDARRIARLAARLGVSPEEFLKRGVAEYLDELEAEPDFDGVGFGMWEDRAELQDSAKWVRELRDREWRR